MQPHRPVPPVFFFPGRQRGALAVMFALMIVLLLGFAGLALDLTQRYTRRLELQNIADGAALAAAAALTGTAAGIDQASAQASLAAASRKIRYTQTVAWSDAALRFASSADAAVWIDAGSAKAMPAAQLATLLFARVDTRMLDAAYGRVDAAFMGLLADQSNAPGVAAVAVAGRKSLRVTPLGICALSTVPSAARSAGAKSELVEYGFRRGIAYNLLSLSPLGAQPLNYLIDPVQPGGSAVLSAAAAAPFVCSGTLPMAVLPATVRVAYPFPPSLSSQLNSRFNTYGTVSPCNALTAPPDSNVRAYVPTLSSPWWAVATSLQTAQNTATAPLVTVADVAAAAPNAASYGVMWSFGPAAVWAADTPAAGYASFLKSDWASLYPVAAGAPPTETAAGINATYTPYGSPAGSYFLAPSPVRPSLSQRRILNVVLLSCSSATGANASATVLGIGRFFMTAPATATSISAEFAGAVSPAALGGPAELFQ
jgi:Flp pilus assembly protein TadG